MRSNVPGVHIPDSIIDRLEGAEDQKKEGRQICIDLIQEVKEIKGVAGIHVMAYRQEEFVSEIISASGVFNYGTLVREPPARAGGVTPK
jgi:5,10-methylenetetrahydrofolate reductase